jgi:hypothetical protein
MVVDLQNTVVEFFLYVGRRENKSEMCRKKCERGLDGGERMTPKAPGGFRNLAAHSCQVKFSAEASDGGSKLILKTRVMISISGERNSLQSISPLNRIRFMCVTEPRFADVGEICLSPQSSEPALK